MLALAPPLHDHPSSHSAPVSAGKTPTTRSKSVARRAPSSTALSSGACSSSSSSSSSSSTSTIVQSGISRSVAPATYSRPEVTLASRQEASPFGSSSSISTDSQTSQRPAHFSLVPMPSSTPTSTPSATDIHSYPTPDLLRLLASLLNQIAAANDALSTQSLPDSSSSSSHPSPTADHPQIWQTLFTASRTALSTPTSPLTFHARNIPSISLEAYLLRILRYCPTTNEVFLSLLVYFDRMSKLAQEATGSRFVIDSYNVHRLVIAGVTVASKFFSDVFYTNSRYAKVGGLPQAELNQLELQFLLLNDFRLAIPTDEMQRYAEQLIRFSQGQAGVDVHTWSNPASSTDPPASAPSRPLQSMGAFDAFGGAIASDSASVKDAPRNTTPKRLAGNSAVTAPSDEHEERDQESSVYSETDTDAETDDEPTIRPTHSCASSDTQSLFSDDASEEADTDDGGTDDERHAVIRQHLPYHRWNSSASSSVDEDRRMASP